MYINRGLDIPNPNAPLLRDSAKFLEPQLHVGMLLFFFHKSRQSRTVVKNEASGNGGVRDRHSSAEKNSRAERRRLRVADGEFTDLNPQQAACGHCCNAIRSSMP